MLRAADLISSCEAVVFDCADTLVHLDTPREVIFRDAATDAGLDLRLNDIARAYELVDFALKVKSSELNTATKKCEFYLNFNAALCAALGVSRSLEELHPILLRRFAERRHWIAFEDAAETLRAVSDCASVHVLANWDLTLDDVLRQAGLRHLLQDVAASAVLGAEKPDPSCFDAFIIRNKLEPARTVYVGNEYVSDVIGARTAGMSPILLDRADRYPAADCLRVRSLRELIPPRRGNLLCRSGET